MTDSKERYSQMLKSERWSETRSRINKYGAGRCEYCGSKTSYPQVHHEKYVGNHPSDTPDDYLKSICELCHFESHWIRRLRLYSAEKKRLYRANVEITEELHQELIKRFRV